MGKIIVQRRQRQTLRLLGSTVITANLAYSALASAQEAPADPDSVRSSGSVEAVVADEGDSLVVTGSRIRRSDTETAAPVTVIDSQSLTDRGIYSAADALNQSTSIDPNVNQAAGNGNSAGNGQQFPQLFGLGAGRTLTLLNGRRMVTSSSGLGDAQVDANIIPTGLLQRIEIVQAGGAAVYGSDAISGVINYILRDNFEGVELDAQAGITDRNDFATYSLRATAGTNFADGRGNVAVNVEWSRTPTLASSARARSNLSRMSPANPADTGPDDGIPSSREVFDVRMWPFNANGVVFNSPAPSVNSFTRLNGNALQFTPDGQSLTTYNVGAPFNVPFGEGGDGYRYSDLAGLRSGVERFSANVIGHYDITDTMTLSTELLFSRTKGSELPQGKSRTILNNAASGAGPVSFTRNNPYLTNSVIAMLSAARPAFATGGSLLLSKYFDGLVNSDIVESTTDTYRGLLALDDEFTLAGRNFYWSLSGSYARVEGERAGWGVHNARYNNAINAVRDGTGTIVCAINADAINTNDDPACAPINPFGYNSVSAAAREYVSVRTGNSYVNEQIDLLAILGGTLFTLPGGDVGFSTAYEHRAEKVQFTPFFADANGLTGAGNRTLASSGKYNTDELSAELLIPLVGGDFTLPLVTKLEASGAYRYVDNSIVGIEHVWSVGGRWTVLEGFAVRASRSSNFRAPTLNQLFAPSNTSLSTVSPDPCDADRINLGPNPAVRRANCLALFTANPQYGAIAGNPGATPAERLAVFQDPSENFANAMVTTGGNPALNNEKSNTLSYGVVLQPRFIPGLTITADRVEVKLEGGLTQFTTGDFAATCYDNVEQPAAFCSAFTRLAAAEGNNPAGTIITGRTTTVNASIQRFEGEVYNISYMVPLTRIFGGNPGSLELAVEATHTTLLESSLTGTTFTRTHGTAAQPEWVGRFDLRYANGPFRFTYQLYYLDRVKSSFDATIETTPYPVLAANYQHNLSMAYTVGNLTLRGGVTNLTDEMPSYPSLSHGDIIGRRFFMGARVRF